MEDWIISTDSNASGIGIVPELSDQDEELFTSMEVDTVPSDEVMALPVEFQITLFFVLGIIIGILLIGNRRF